MTPQVTVVIPCFNQASYLPYAVESVLAQTLGDFEAIIVDDGSTDETPQIAASFTDSRIRYVRQENRGLAGARNTGIRHARADLIALLDADDLWHPRFLATMVSTLDAHPEAAATYCGFQYIDRDGHPVGKPSVRVVAPERFLETLICQGNWLSACSVVMRKRYAEEVGLFDETLHAVEDADLWARLAIKWPFIGVHAALVYYRRHGGNMSGQAQRMVQASLQSTAKLFGPPVGDPSGWPPLKRCAYARAHRSAIIRFLAAGELALCLEHVRSLIAIAPEGMRQLEFWRQVIRAHLPWEYQDLPERIDWRAAQRDVMRILGMVEETSTAGHEVRLAPGAARLALAQMARIRGHPREAWRWALRAAASCPSVIIWRMFWGTLVYALRDGMRSARSAEHGTQMVTPTRSP